MLLSALEVSLMLRDAQMIYCRRSARGIPGIPVYATVHTHVAYVRTLGVGWQLNKAAHQK